MKRKMLSLLAMIMLVMSVAACGSNSPESGSTKTNSTEGSSDLPSETSDLSGTVRMALAGNWQLDDGIDPISGKQLVGLKKLIKEKFESKFPNIKLEISEVPWENTQAKQKALLMSNDIDVLYTAGGWASEWYEQGFLREIDDLIAADPSFKPEAYLQGIWDFSYNTKSLDGTARFGVPAVMGRRMTVFDKKIFDDFGVPYLSEVPTPEEILDKAKLLTGKNPKTGEQTYGVMFLGNVLDASVFQALTRYYNAPGGEGTLGDLKNIKFQMNSPEMVNVFEFLKEISKYAPPAFVNGQGGENFGTEANNIAISLDDGGYGAWSSYSAEGDETFLDRFQSVMNIGPDGGGYVAVDPFVISKKTEVAQAAWEVVKFMAGYDVQKHMYESLAFTPTLANADFLDPKDQYVVSAMKIADVAKSNLMDEVNPFFNSEVVPAVNNFISLSANNKAPDIESYLANLQDRAVKWQAALK
ncbi:ABC transporter substrate-binding protein [Paenibacillus nasutitermitis]|uniref:ABC transporter substrate-binding protein n=1 Tax=Paenibacillus nasutitermitis TaxID=1652958 RepID=A0A916ZL75_9BACL|nr:extracellular solute-binding protein [Paenibacillus nasutitermitis]GGE03062.1 hypothetical protein GCM10010911_72690 [Paenibacillus nasutitermitis]